MKILMIGSHRSVKGGITSVVNQLLNHDWESDVEISYVPTFIEGPSLKKIFFFIGGYINILLKVLFSSVDIIYLHMSYNGSFWRKYYVHNMVKLFNKKTIIHLHGSEFKKFYDNSDNRTKIKIKKLFYDCDTVIVLGERWRKIIQDIQPCVHIEVLSNSVSIPTESCQLQEHFQILYLGMLIKRKGVSDLIDAISLLSENNFFEGKNVEIIITGTGAEESILKNKVQQLSLSKYIKFIGWIDNAKKKEILKNTQLLILPSYNEGLPVCILEAMSYGIPVISTNVGSIPEVVIHGVNGEIISPGNKIELASSIQKIIDSPYTWTKYSRNSRTLIEENFNEVEYFRKLLGIFNHNKYKGERYED